MNRVQRVKGGLFPSRGQGGDFGKRDQHDTFGVLGERWMSGDAGPWQACTLAMWEKISFQVGMWPLCTVGRSLDLTRGTS